MNEKDFLGRKSVKKLLIRLSIPTITAQLVTMLYNIVDRIYIGHIPVTGSLAITGVGVCTPLILISTAFASLAGAGGAPKVSISMGEGDYESAEKIQGNCFTMLILVSVILTMILLIGNRTFLYSFGASDASIPYALTYMNIYACGTIFVQLTVGMNAYITAQGFTMVSMRTTVVGAALNIVLDPVLIFGFGMGVAGAAAATVLSQGVSCLLVLGFLFGKKTHVPLSRRNMGLSPKVILPCMALGVSPFIMQSSESLLNICFNTSLLKYGGDMAVGSMTILFSLLQFIVLPAHGLAQGAQPIIGYNYGAKNAGRVKETVITLICVALSYTTLMYAAMMLFPKAFVSLFTSDPAFVAFASAAMRIYFATAFVHGLQIACQMTFLAIGFARSSVIVAVMRKFVLLIPAIYLTPLIFGRTTDSVFLAEPIADVIAVSFTGILFAVQFRKVLASMRKTDVNIKESEGFR